MSFMRLRTSRICLVTAIMDSMSPSVMWPSRPLFVLLTKASMSLSERLTKSCNYQARDSTTVT
jgi:hypothetical protein